jgi:dTDP-4-dehydrorhamnose reductase
LRTNFFGPSHCPGRRSLTDWLLQSLIQQRAITAFNDIRFSPLSIERLVDLLGAIVARRRQGIFNLGSRNGMSKAEFAYMFAAVMGVPTTCMTSGTSDRMKLVAYRPKDMRMDSSSFEDAFGVALPTLQEEIHSMKRAYAYEAG